MTQEEALRPVLLDPADDAPRLVYADWLDDHGQGERAEFIRVQCRAEFLQSKVGGSHANHTDAEKNCFRCAEVVALRRRERELLAAHGDDWFGMPVVLTNSTPGAAEPYGVVSRGFVSAVSLPTAAFVGGPCGRCGGLGRTPGRYPDDWRHPTDDCLTCKGTGRVEGVARRLFAVHPITSVTLSNVRVWRTGSIPESQWTAGAGNGQAALGEPIFDFFADADLGWPYPTEAAAVAALSAACVVRGRSLAGVYCA